MKKNQIKNIYKNKSNRLEIKSWNLIKLKMICKNNFQIYMKKSNLKYNN